MAEITKSLKETAGKITGGFGRGLSKLSSVFKSKKIEPAMSETSGSMSNTQYLGSIYQLMVDSDEERRLEYQRELNLKEESDSEEQRQHQEIIKALTLRREPKRKKGISKEQKQSEKVEKTAKSTVGKKTKKPKVPKKGEPAKKDEPAKKPTDAEKDKRKEQKSSAKDEQIKKDKKSADDAKAAADKKTADAKTSAQKKEADRAQEAAKKKADDAKAAEEAKKASDARRAADDASKKRIAEDRAKKEAETKAKKEAPKTEAPKKEAPKTAEPVKQTQKPAAPKPAEPVKAPETVKPPTATQKPSVTTKPPVTTASKLPKGMSAVAGPIIGAMVAAGITNVYAQRAILANVQKETQGTELEENLLKYKGTSANRIREVFTTRVKHLNDSEIDVIKKDPYKFGELVYGKNTVIGQSMGNTEEGDGYKYRGRGFIQLTGKNNYKEYSKIAGIDLVKNPDALLQPDIAAKISAEFIKRGRGKKGLEFTNQEEANRAVTQTIGGAKLNLDKGIGAKLLSTVNNY